MAAVRLVTSPYMHVFHHYGILIADIRALLARNWNVTIPHVFREVNACADRLAPLGVGQDDVLKVFQEPPSGWGPLILADAMGVTYSP